MRSSGSGMEKSYFWGITLDDAHKEYKWEGSATENTDELTVTTHTLCVRQIVLGPDAKDDEVNVVEVECFGYENKKYKIPIAVLKAGSGSHVVTTEVVLEDQFATFRLIKGSGPIYISGSHQTETTIVGEDDIDDTMGEDEIDDEDEDEEEVEDVPVR
ncbi:Nucleoplasmin-like protein [Armadillidium vulgare]|nr:Nucleoplasmin-like protein [Armadillidium vulgare]